MKFNLSLTKDELQEIFFAMLYRHQQIQKTYGRKSAIHNKTHDLYVKVLNKSCDADEQYRKQEVK